MWRFIGVFFLINFCESFDEFRLPTIIEKEVEITYSFPKEFSFGAATAAYQVSNKSLNYIKHLLLLLKIEGGWQEDGKGPSIWDTLAHDHPELIADHSTGDVGPDSYHFFKKDIQALKEIGVSFHLVSRRA